MEHLIGFFCTPCDTKKLMPKAFLATIKDMTTLGASTVDSTNEIRYVDGNDMKIINISPFP